VNISFDNKKLEKYANNDQQGIRILGPLRHKKYKTRLDQLRASKNLLDLKHQPGRFHELTGDRKGQWACDLDQPYRLIFSSQKNQNSITSNEKSLLIEVIGVEIIEIVDYHN
jgi:proteic killer suppression protein